MQEIRRSLADKFSSTDEGFPGQLIPLMGGFGYLPGG